MSPRLAVLTALLLAACGSSSRKEEARDRPRLPAPLASELPDGKLYVTSRESDFMDMLDELEQADVVYIGAEPGNPDHHIVQLRIIEHLVHRRRLHAIGIDTFERSFQQALKDYIEGEIDENALASTELLIEPYRSILGHARANRIPVLALAVEDEIREPMLQGGRDAVPEAVRVTLPAVDVTLFPAHRARWRAAWTGSDADFEHAYFMRCLEEEVIADGIVRWFRTAPDDSQIVVLAGVDRIANRNGIPDRAHRRNGRSYLTVVPLAVAADDLEREQLARAYADFVWLTPPAPRAAD